MNVLDDKKKNVAAFAEALPVFLELFLVQDGIKQEDTYWVVVDVLHYNHGPIFAYLNIVKTTENKAAFKALYCKLHILDSFPVQSIPPLTNVPPAKTTAAPTTTPAAPLDSLQEQPMPLSGGYTTTKE